MEPKKICPNCKTELRVGSKFCTNCGMAQEDTSNELNQEPVKTETKKPLVPADFAPVYSLPTDEMVREYIKMELSNLGVNEKTKEIPHKAVKRKKVYNVIFSLLLFIYLSLIFFHFPIATYIVGLIILGVFFVATRKYDLISYEVKQVQLRPSEKISNILMSEKSTFVQDDSKKVLLMGTLISIVLLAIVFWSPRIIYEKTDGGYAVRYYIYGVSNFTKATIPDTYKNEKVVTLRGNTFSNMMLLQKAEIPDTVTEIRGQAFKNCFLLKEVKLPANLEYLGGGAFYNAKSLQSIELPDSLTYLGGETFYGSSSLENVKLSNNLLEIRGDTFEYCTSLKTIEIPDSITRIGGHAFYGDSSLYEVKISEESKLEEIGSSAFRQCSRLLKIRIPYRTVVNERAFKESPTNVVRYLEKKVDYSTSESEYLCVFDEVINFTKYNLKVRVYDENNGIISVKADSALNGLVWGDIEDGGYIINNGCKIEVNIKEDNQYLIKISNVEELAEQYKNSKNISVYMNEEAFVDDNLSIVYLGYEEIGTTKYYKFVCDRDGKKENFVVTKKEGLAITNSDLMIEILALNNTGKIVVYYN